MFEFLKKLFKREEDKQEKFYQSLVKLAEKPKLSLEPGTVHEGIKVTRWKQHPTIPYERIPIVEEE